MVQYFVTITTLHSSQFHSAALILPSLIIMTVYYIPQAFTAFGPTLIQPTWFCSRELFEKVGPFSEQGKVRATSNVIASKITYKFLFQGTPEDLMFFHKHLSLGGKLLKIEKELLMYRHHPDCESFSVSRLAILFTYM